MNWRNVSKSRSNWLRAPPNAAARSMTAEMTRPAMRRSSRMLARVSTRARTTSRPASATNATSSAMVSISSVTWLRARDHPVIDLQHVERRREVEQVDRQAEDQPRSRNSRGRRAGRARARRISGDLSHGRRSLAHHANKAGRHPSEPVHRSTATPDLHHVGTYIYTTKIHGKARLNNVSISKVKSSRLGTPPPRDRSALRASGGYRPEAKNSGSTSPHEGPPLACPCDAARAGSPSASQACPK